MNMEAMQKQIKTIFQKLDRNEQKIVNQMVGQTLDDIL